MKRTTFFLILTLALCGITPSVAQETTSTFNWQEATQAYLDTMSPEQKAKSDAYFEGGYWLMVWNFLFGLFVAWLLLAKGLSNWMYQNARKISGKTNLVNLVYVMQYVVVTFLIGYPLSLYEDFFREHQYELSNLTYGAWMGEQAKGLIIGIIVMSLVIMLLYMAICKAQQAWWLWGASGSLVFLMIIMFLAPVFLMPIFNTYYPLEDEAVKEDILSMARANDVPVDNVYQFDASKQSKRISANVSGIGSTIRISLNDNLLNRCSKEEVKAVMGHELGHYVLNHSYKGIMSFGLLILLCFAFVQWAYQRMIEKYGAQWHIDSISDIRAFPLFVALFSVFFFFATPFTNTIIRTQEMESDIFGLNAAREPDGFASTAIKLSEYRKIDPGYWEEILFFDHPSGRVRVETAMKWKAENLRKGD
ncbi:MAG: M48 family metallopeptidase [Cyclobacteriaceae bacterium]